MFEGLKKFGIETALESVREKYLNPKLQGIGEVKKISYKDGKFHLVLELAGMENQPIDIEASEITLAPDWSTVSIGWFESSMPFMKTALNRYASEPFDIPAGKPRMIIGAAAKVLGL